MYLRQSTASQEILLGRFVDDEDGVTAMTGLTIANTDIDLFKGGATSMADKNSGGATHIAGGLYYAVLDATDTDTVGNLEVHVAVSGALPVMRTYTVLEEAVYDQLFAASAPGAATVAALATVDTEIGVIDGIVDDILADTATLAALTSAVATIDTEVGVIDGIVDQILEDTATTIPASLTTIDSEIGVIDGLVDAIKLVTDRMGLSIVSGAAETGTLSTTVMTTDLAEATNDHYNGRMVIWTSGALAGQASLITDYLGSTGQLTYETVTDSPSNGDTFLIV